MNINELDKFHREVELNTICKWIESASLDELALMISVMIKSHNNLYSYNEDSGRYCKLYLIINNGSCIFLKLDEEINKKSQLELENKGQV